MNRSFCCQSEENRSAASVSIACSDVAYAAFGNAVCPEQNAKHSTLNPTLTEKTIRTAGFERLQKLSPKPLLTADKFVRSRTSGKM